jgi:hypothetical protein
VPLPTASVILWLTGLGWDVTQESGAPIVPGSYVPKEPDKIVIVTSTPGPGYVLEAAADAGCFQARTRGAQNDQPGAEALAYLLDSLILGASFPVTIGGRVIIHVHRLGGTPSLLLPSPDDGDRYEYTCSYLCIAGT